MSADDTAAELAQLRARLAAAEAEIERLRNLNKRAFLRGAREATRRAWAVGGEVAAVQFRETFGEDL